MGTRVRDRSVSKRLFFFFFYRSGYQIDAVLSFSVEIAESHFEIWRKLSQTCGQFYVAVVIISVFSPARERRVRLLSRLIRQAGFFRTLKDSGWFG